jgi:ferredoxin-nitrate reductase
MQIAVYTALTIESEVVLQIAYLNVASRHKRDAGIRDGCHRAARFAEIRLQGARELTKKFGATSSHDPKLLANALFHGLRADALGLVRDLHDLSLLANQSLLCWTGVSQACKALHDEAAVATCEAGIKSLQLEISRLNTELKEAAPQALTISTPLTHQIATGLRRLPAATFSQRAAMPVLKAAAFTTAGLIGFLAGRRRSA